MFLRICSVAVFFIVCNAASAQEAQRVRDVGIRAIERAIQCEIGKFANLVRGQHLSPDRLKAGYAVSEKIVNTGGGGIDIGFAILTFGAKQTQGTTDDNELDFDPVNINAQNAKACSRNQTTLQLAGLRECLAGWAPVYDHAKAKCSTQINVKRDLSAGFKVPWIVTFGPSGSYGTDYSQAIKVNAPPGKP